MFQSLKTRFVGGQDGLESPGEVKLDFTEAVDGDDFVLVDVLPSPAEDDGQRSQAAPDQSAAAPQPARRSMFVVDENVITEEPTGMTLDGRIVSSEAQPTMYMSDDQQLQQAWTVRPMDLPFWLSNKLQALVSCQRLTQNAVSIAESEPPMRHYSQVAKQDVIDEKMLAAALASPVLNYDFQNERHVVAFDQSVYLNN